MYIHNETQVSPIDEKIELLNDFKILEKKATKQELKMRLILAACKSEIEMEHKLHNVLYANETLNSLLDRHKGEKYMKLMSELDFIIAKFKQIRNLREYAENLRKSGEYNDFETRLGWDCLKMTVPSDTICGWYNKYDCNDNHITTLVKAALKKVLGGT